MLQQSQCRVLLGGQTAVVTGGSSGIGAAIAQGLGYSGANVVVNYSGGKERAEEVVSKIKEVGGSAMTFQADVSTAVFSISAWARLTGVPLIKTLEARVFDSW